MDLSLKGECLFPFWKSGRMYAETVLALKREGDAEACGSLAFKPLKIEKVTDYTGSKVYREGKDYVLDGRKIIFKQDGCVPQIAFSQLVGKDIGAFPASDKVNKIYCAEGSFLQEHQAAVTYTFEKSDFPLEIGVSEKLSAALSKLKSAEKFRILFYGDSITTGCSSSGWQNLPPFTPSYTRLVHGGLQEAYGREIEYENTAVGGTGTDWALENVEERLISLKPDLTVLAFGINDGILVSKDKYKRNVAEIIKKTRKQLRDAQFLLVDCFTPSPYALTENYQPFLGTQRQFWQADRELCDEFEGVDTAPLGSVHDVLLQSKFYADMLVNNINHPNDFLTRLFAQVILAKLTEF